MGKKLIVTFKLRSLFVNGGNVLKQSGSIAAFQKPWAPDHVSVSDSQVRLFKNAKVMTDPVWRMLLHLRKKGMRDQGWREDMAAQKIPRDVSC